MFALACNNKSETALSPLAYDKAHDAAVLMYDNGQQDAATKHIDSAYKNSKQLDLGRMFNYYLFDYNYYSHYKNDKKRALLYADSILDLFDTKEKKIRYSNEYGQAHFFKGDILFDQAEYTEAYQYFYQGKVIGNNNLDECIVSDYSYRMAMIMYKQENYKLAAANFKNSFKEINGCPLTFNSFYRRQEVLNNTGLSYGKITMADSALYFYDRALKYIDKYAGEFKSRPQKLDVARGVVYGNQANIHIDLKNYDLAKTLLKKSININLLKDSINKKNKLLKEADIAEQIKRLEKDNEFDRLKKNNQQQNIYLNVTVVFVVMLVMIISLVFLNWQKSKKNIQTLGGLNQQINEQNTHLEHALSELKLNSQEKDRILRAVAHDLRNPIGGIASLTSVMSEDDYTDEQKEMLNLIKETSFNSLELINEILEATNSASTGLNASV
jgi:tetratricopeptide (TPR) repeat protein